ncbi:MAG: sigma-70 family RNA polymerase sigma factor [Planctomycetia bacterium]|nr:sigma-70 family RNA polymerase sigma factor [Planctomycetia bacterium]
MIHSMTLEDSLADDLVQEVFLRAFRGLASFQGRSKFTTWLYRVTMNTVHETLDRQRRSPIDRFAPLPDVAVPNAPSPERNAMGGELGAAVACALARLPEKLRAAIVLVQMPRSNHDCCRGFAAAVMVRSRHLVRRWLGGGLGRRGDLAASRWKPGELARERLFQPGAGGRQGDAVRRSETDVRQPDGLAGRTRSPRRRGARHRRCFRGRRCRVRPAGRPVVAARWRDGMAAGLAVGRRRSLRAGDRRSGRSLGLGSTAALAARFGRRRGGGGRGFGPHRGKHTGTVVLQRRAACR